jgi:hypothetical protein
MRIWILHFDEHCLLHAYTNKGSELSRHPAGPAGRSRWRRDLAIGTLDVIGTPDVHTNGGVCAATQNGAATAAHPHTKINIEGLDVGKVSVRTHSLHNCLTFGFATVVTNDHMNTDYFSRGSGSNFT